ALDQAINLAWNRLVPQLHSRGFAVEDSAFVAALARLSEDRGWPEQRRATLLQVIRVTEAACARPAPSGSWGPGPPGHLAALKRRAIRDEGAAGADVVSLVVAAVGDCFDGKLSLAFAEQLLAGWPAAHWAGRNRNRLRILICDRAFEAGFEVQDLVEAGEAAPALAELLETADTDELARLRLLWSLRATTPWDRCGKAVTVFELAALVLNPAESPFLDGLLT